MSDYERMRNSKEWIMSEQKGIIYIRFNAYIYSDKNSGMAFLSLVLNPDSIKTVSMCGKCRNHYLCSMFNITAIKSSSSTRLNGNSLTAIINNLAKWKKDQKYSKMFTIIRHYFVIVVQRFIQGEVKVTINIH